MKNSKKEGNKSRTPYEPPRLLNLGSGVAHAQGACQAGGSPTIATCTPGSSATSAACKTGTLAGATCGTGGVAAGGSCKSGSTATYSCKAGSDPM